MDFSYHLFLQVYSEELETIAQQFANRCIITHSEGRERSSKAPSFIVVELVRTSTLELAYL